jgi:hypothetical protein
MKTSEGKNWKRALLLGLLTCFTLFSSGQDVKKIDIRSRTSKVPAEVQKITPRADLSIVNILAGSTFPFLTGQTEPASFFLLTPRKMNPI